MPGIKELEKFREELTNLGNEREVTEQRGETYEPFPSPEQAISAALPSDVDTILSSIEENTSSSGTEAGEEPDDFGSVLESLPLEGTDEALSGSDTSAEVPGFDDFSIPEFPESETPAPVEELSEEVEMEALEPLEEEGAPVSNEPVDAIAGLDALLAAGLPDLEDSDSDDFSIPEEFAAPDISASVEMPFAEDASEESASVEELVPDLEELPDFDSPVEEAPVAETPIAETPAEEPALDTLMPDFDLPEAEFSAGEGETGESGESGDYSLPDDFSMPSLDDFTMPEEPAASAEADEEASETGGFEIPALDDFPVESGAPFEGAAGEPGEPVEEPAEPVAAESFGEAAVEPGEPVPDELAPGLDEFDLTPPSEMPEGGLPSAGGTASPKDDFADFAVPDDLPVLAEEESAEDQVIDGFDGFSLDEDILHAGHDAGGDEFHIPGFSDFTGGAGFDGLDELMPKGMGSSAKKEIPLEISEESFQQFLGILARYPLNLRMAIEEYLSQDEGSEQQKMEIVHQILQHTPLKKIARTMEDRLKRSIPIPKDFEKKTAAEYEEEKASLKYFLLNKVLPAAVLFTGVSILTFCVVFLSWRFIYRPLAAESLYKRGYAAIEDARYTQSMGFFDEAVVIWEKKKWYFRYARAFRDRRQYVSAETMYERLLNRYDNDRDAGLEYAQMLRSDLRNFEKAETVLKRRILDNYVNDPDGMMLLGDTYLDWGEEDPARYEQARALYASLIELYGRDDPYLARMMRYFIRTDNLGEVLPLKDYFVSKRRNPLESADLVELSGYLVDKRYNPAPDDSEVLRSQIDDVRDLLDSAVEADPSVPEAHYNMGKFFINNYAGEKASLALSEALRLYENASPMSPRRVLTRVDAFRLLGEIRAENKEYLDAQGIYSRGMELYEQQRKNRAVPQDPRAGRLYADAADIEYFISNDLDSALRYYTRAIEELQDTPSIRYRVGYIQYQERDFSSAMQEFSRAYAERPQDKNVRYSFANTLFRRGNLFASQGHYERLMESLEAERIRKGIIFPQARSDHASFVEQYMKTANNLGVTLDRIARRTGDSSKNARALTLLSESARAWDSLTRNPETLVRLSRITRENEGLQDNVREESSVNGNLAYMNIKYMTHPVSSFSPELYNDIPKVMDGEPVLQQREDQ